MKLSNAVLSAALLLSATAYAGEWEIDPSHSQAQFGVKHMMVSTVRGEFQKLSGTVDYDEKNPTAAKIDVTIDASSINTREPKRDAHLKSPDFFDVEKNPNITFRSTKVEKAGKNKFKVTGDLTMRGVTRPVTLDTELTNTQKDMMGRTVRGVSAIGKLNRKEWGLEWNKAIESGGVLVGDEVKLQIDAELVAKAAAPAKTN
jgi:polyisoprenoid-binding protein YceI